MDALEVAVVEALEVLEVVGIVGVGPLEVAVGAEPLEVAAAAAPGVEGARQVEVGPAGRLVDGDLDLLEVGALVLPVLVHLGIHLRHGDLVVHAVGAGDLRGDELVEGERGDAALVEGLTVEVGRALPGGDALQVGRALGRDAPLVHGDAGVAGHAHVAVAPGLGAQPLDEVVAVLAVLMGEHVDVALGVAGAAHVDVGDGVALVAPVERVGGLELGGLGHGHGRHAHDLPLAHAVAGALAEPRPGDDRGNLGTLDDVAVLVQVARAEDVGVDLAAVTHDDFLVLHADDAGGHLVDALVEGRAEALAHASHGVVGGGKVDFLLVVVGLAGHQVGGHHLDALEGLGLEEEVALAVGVEVDGPLVGVLLAGALHEVGDLLVGHGAPVLGNLVVKHAFFFLDVLS